MAIDLTVLAMGFGSFVIFLGMHLVLMRCVRPEALLKSITGLFAVSVAAHLAVVGNLWAFKVLDLTTGQWLAALAVSFLAYGLAAFNYILCVFGPYETSVRMRLVREIAAVPAGIAEKDLRERYNEGVIVDIRLRRLIGSGDIHVEDGIYRSRTAENVFFLLDRVAGTLKTWIGK